MPKYFYPTRLKRGDEIRVIAPSYSATLIPKQVAELATTRLEEMGFKITFGKHVGEKDEYESSPLNSRLEDLMDAFKDKNVKGIMAAVGGYNVNYLLQKIDWEIIKNNPKFFCGMSDITVLQNAILKKTGLVTFSGPNFRNFGQKKYAEYTIENFKEILFGKKNIKINPSEVWSDDRWTKDQEKRKLIKNNGWWKMSEGRAMGNIVGGNLCSLNLLQGTEFMPDLKGSILFIEDDDMSTVGEFSRNWQSLMHLKDFKKIKGIVFGRFQKKTKMSENLLKGLVETNDMLKTIPIIGNVDFGHTDPKITFPIGGRVTVLNLKGKIEIKILSF